jgi:hypothetical protein
MLLSVGHWCQILDMLRDHANELICQSYDAQHGDGTDAEALERQALYLREIEHLVSVQMPHRSILDLKESPK